ncbi:transcriptional regulator FtsR [Kocuria sp.]|uniref:transcriptional regulator FtsR n=1 Tax=Kocuria sp. TaxID=1871328 RepID=UPI0026DEDFBE|nr:MerR family transcriptional regulator [Kocuria sp.]MDO5618477.1 MerR family transcriptional regulator [Kocuria sp.]
MTEKARVRRIGMGALLQELQPDFPDISASKVRFLEDQGLLHPARTPSGYRKFAPEDVQRLRQVLILQRERYLPLKVIRELSDNGRLEQLLAQTSGSAAEAAPERTADGHAGSTTLNGAAAGESTAASPESGGGQPQPGHTGTVEDSGAAATTTSQSPPPQSAPQPAGPVTMRELCRQSGAGIPLVRELISFGLIHERPGGFDRHDVVIAGAARALRDHGVEPRHLRTLRQAADREMGLVEQAIAPDVAKRSPVAARRASERAGEITQLCLSIHASLVVGQLESVQQRLSALSSDD